MKEKMCFVIMGFGRKKDPISNRTIDLDQTYKQIIKPAVEASGYRCVRADEISDSGLIDRSMYALLYRAQLVIADISTYNPNAIYELGVRHTLKPFATIIIREDEGGIPFDINHNRILSYKHLGNEISDQEAKQSIRQLRDTIASVTNNEMVDSPLYTYIPDITKPSISDETIASIIGDLKGREDTVYSLQECARNYMAESNFSEAAKRWIKLSEIVSNEDFFVQQAALCTYKSEKPSALVALNEASKIINRISHKKDTETLGIIGTINKNLWYSTEDMAFLIQAIESYKMGWNVHKDYYTGENYAFCLEQRYLLETDSEMKIYLKVEAKMIREEIVNIILKSFEEEEIEETKWKYATLSNCYLSLGETGMYEKYEALFLAQEPLKWEVDTYNKSLELVKKYRSEIE